MMQLDLPLARTSDPATSHAAGHAAVDLQARHVALIYSALLLAQTREHVKPAGYTKDEIAAVTRLDATQVARRGKDGEGKFWRIGPETRAGATGRQCRVWFAL